ncbi:MAG: polymerase [Micrococcales bacterium]|nr:MAG: polymerase [Micrococcales bacterium]
MRLHPQLAKLAPAVLVVVWAWSLYRARRWPRAHLVSILAIALLGVVLASTAINTANTFGLDYLGRWVPFLILTVALVDILAEHVHPQVAIYAAAYGATVTAVGALFSFIVLGDPRASGPMEDPNDLAYVLAGAVPLLLLGPARSCRRWVAWSAYVATVLCLAGVAMTVSRGGVLALVVCFVWAMWRRLLRPRTIIAGALIVATGAVIVVAVAGSTVRTALSQKMFIGTRNVETRALRWEAALRQITDHPLLGVGPGGNRENYVAYSNFAEADETSPVTHNMYIEVASEIGLIGFFLFISILVIGVMILVRRAGEDRYTALAAQGSLITLLTASTFLSQQYYTPLWVMVAMAAALDLRRRRVAR